jgi:hypothetical protein
MSESEPDVGITGGRAALCSVWPGLNDIEPTRWRNARQLEARLGKQVRELFTSPLPPTRQANIWRSMNFVAGTSFAGAIICSMRDKRGSAISSPRRDFRCPQSNATPIRRAFRQTT